jgi:hypothetical protein
MTITLMTFASPPEDQWQMVLEAIGQAFDDADLGHIAAGPLEGLLGRHGEETIELIEAEAARDQKFARAVTGVWKYTMSEEIWTRVQAIQSRIPIELWLPDGRAYALARNCGQ